MAQTIKLKRSAQSGASGIPSTSDLALGEVGINTYHGKMYIKKDDGTESIVEVGSTGSFLPLSGGSLTGNLSLGDNVKAQFGAGSDLQIFHDGVSSTSYFIEGNATGNMEFRASGLRLKEGDGGNYYFLGIAGGSSSIYHNGSKKLETTATGIDVTGSVTADLLTTDDDVAGLTTLGRYSSGFAYSLLRPSASATGLEIRTNAGNALAHFLNDGTTKLHHNGTAKLSTTSTGISISNNANFPDNGKAIFGASDDLQIYHDGNNSRIYDVGTGDLRIQGTNLRLMAEHGENYLYAVQDAWIKLYYNGLEKLATTSTGIDVTGNIESDSVTIGVGSVATTEKLRVNGTVLTLGGSVSTPAIGIGDVNTGVYAPTAGTLGWTVNGTQRLLLNSTGIDVTGSVVADGLTASTSGNQVLLLDSTNGATTIQMRTSSGSINTFIRSGVGGSSNLKFETNSADALTLDASQNVNIPNGGLMVGSTTAPSANLHVKNTSSNAVIKVETAGGLDSRLILDAPAASGAQSQIFFDASGTTAGSIQYTHNSGGTNFMTFHTGGSNVERMRIDSSGSVGIGTSSPTANLVVTQSGSTPTSGFQSNQWQGCFVNTGTTTSIARVGIYSGNATTALLNFGDADDADIGGLSYDNSDNSLAIRTNNAERMRIFSDGDVSIGMTYNYAKLNVNGDIRAENSRFLAGRENASAPAFAFHDDGDTGIFNINPNILGFATGGQEAARIDASQNFLVGTSNTTWQTQEGLRYFNGNSLIVTRDSDEPMSLNRLTNDGDLLIFRKDGSTVGSIGVEGGDLTIGKGTVTGLQFWSNQAIRPFSISSNSRVDNVLDLGESNTRFKDLYLSNKVYAAYIGASSDTDTSINFDTANTIKMFTGGQEAARIDASQNFLVGKTSTDFGTVGSRLSAAGEVQGTVSGATVAAFNRKSSSGEITSFWLDTVQKGNISVSSFGMGFGGGTRSSDFFLKTDGTASFASGVDVGIGTGSPSSYLPEGSNLVVADSSHAGITIASGTTSEGGIFFADGTSGTDRYMGMIRYNHASNYMEFRTGAGERARITSGNEFLIGCTSAGDYGITLDGSPSSNSVPSMELVRDFSGTATMIRFTNISGSPYVGSITSTTSATAYNTSSDERLKDNIKDADDSGSKVDAIQVRQFDWKADGEHQDYGMVAQELLKVAPDAVSQGDTPDDMMGVDYSKLVPMLIKEIQSLRQRVAQLEE